MSEIDFFLQKLFKHKNQLKRIYFLRNNPSNITEELFWYLHFQTLVFLTIEKWPQALEIMELVIEINDLLNRNDINSHCKNLQIACYIFLGEFKRAEGLLIERTHIHHLLKEWSKLGETLFQLGKLYGIFKKEKALETLTKATEYLLKSNRLEELTLSYLTAGKLHISENNPEKAFMNFNNAWEYCKKTKSYPLIIETLTWLSFINEFLKRDETALEYTKKAIEISKNSSRFLTSLISTMARLYRKTDCNKEASKYYTRLLELKKEIDFKQALGQNLYYRGIILMHAGLFKKAYKCFYEALIICRQTGSWQTELCLLHSIGTVRRKMGEPAESLSFFLKPKKEIKNILSQKSSENIMTESKKFNIISLNYIYRGVREYYVPPYTGKIQFSRGTIFEFASTHRPQKKLIEALESFLGKGNKENLHYITEEPLVKRKVLQEEIGELSTLLIMEEKYPQALSLLKEALAINFFSKNDTDTEFLLKIKEIYKKTGFYQKGIEFFQKAAKKSIEEKMYRTASLCYKLGGNLLAENKYFSEAMLLLRKSLSLRKQIGERNAIIDLLLELAEFHQNSGGYPVAENYYKEALEECKKSRDKEKRIKILKSLANLFTRQKRIGKAVKIYKEIAKKSLEDIHDGEEKLSNLLLAGNKCELLENPGYGLKIYKSALIAAYRYKSGKKLITFLEATGKTYEDLGIYKKAESCYKLWMKLSKKGNLKNKRSSALTSISRLKYIEGDIEKAKALIEQSITFEKDANNRLKKWEALVYCGKIEEEMGNTRDANKLFSDSYKIITEDFSFEPAEASSNFHLGINYYLGGKINQALFYLRESFKLYSEELKKEDLYGIQKASIMTYMALIYLILGKLESAEKYAQKCLKIYETMKIPSGQAEHLQILGEIKQKEGKYSKAKYYFKRSLHIHKKTKNRSGEIKILSIMGKLYLTQKNYVKAKKIGETILEDKKNDVLKRIIAEEKYNTGCILYYSGDFTGALEQINSAVILFQSMKYKAGTVKGYRTLGEINIFLKNFSEAFNNFSYALEVAHKCGLLNHQCIILIHMAYIERMKKNYTGAFEMLAQAKEIGKKICRPDLDWKISFELAKLALAEKRYRQGVRFFNEAIYALEDYPWLPLINLSQKDFRATLTEKSEEIDLYNGLIEYFLETGQNEEALTLIERAKAFLRMKKLQTERDKEKKEHLKKAEQKELFQRIDLKRLFFRLVNQEEMETELMPEIALKYMENKKEYKDAAERLIKKIPSLKSGYKPVYLSTEDIKNILPRESSLIEYYFTDKNLIIFCLYASPENFHTLKIGLTPLPEKNLSKNLPEDFSEEDLKNLFNHIKKKFPDLEFSKNIYYLIKDEILLWEDK